MARLKLLSLSSLSFSSLKKERLIFFINLMIFLSLFALSTSVISMYYENKIDSLDGKIINEETNILIYENQIQKTPIIIKNIQNTINNNSSLKDYANLLEVKNTETSTILTAGDVSFKPFWRLLAVSNYGATQIGQSLSDAILVSNNIEDLNKIEKINNIFKKINDDNRKINKKKDKIVAEYNLLKTQSKNKKNDSSDDKMDYYNKFENLNTDLLVNLQEQINFLVNFNLNFFPKKKKETEKFILNLEKELNKFSNQESIIILSAFLLQLIIFLSVQYFEISMEAPSAKRTKKK